MINMGTHEVFIDEEDGWTVVTEDELPSAQWEHTFRHDRKRSGNSDTLTLFSDTITMTTILAIESSCDDTSAAVMRDG